MSGCQDTESSISAALIVGFGAALLAAFGFKALSYVQV